MMCLLVEYPLDHITKIRRDKVVINELCLMVYGNLKSLTSGIYYFLSVKLT